MNKNPIRACVIGHPVSQSLSPLIHNHWFAQYGVDGSYDTRDIAPAGLLAGVRALVASGYAGFNVTVPHKTAVRALCGDLDDNARLVGAVNTVVVRDGILHGMNTDVFGFIENIRRAAPGFDFKRGPALVLGAGGAARAVVAGLVREGVADIRLANRTRATAAAFQTTWPVTVVDWDARAEAAAGCALLVNTTVLGMTGQLPLDFDLSHLPPDALVCDIVYKPLHTPLLLAARARGNVTVTGIGMLLHQARPAFHAWTGVMPDIDLRLEQALRGATT